jgi:transcriptional regulator with XRE-family HTH domain
MPSFVRHQDLGDTLSALRKSRGLSQAELAYRAEVHATMITRYERNVNKPTRDTLDRLMHALDASTAIRAAAFRQAGYETDLVPITRTALPGSVFVVHTSHKPLMAFADEQRATEYRDGLGQHASRFTHIDSIPLKG